MKKICLQTSIWLMFCLIASSLFCLTTSSWAEEPVVKWVNEEIKGVSSPAIGQDGTIYVGAMDNKVYAVNPADGIIKWVCPTDGAIYSSPVIGEDGIIYVGSYDKNLYAINPEDGSKKWMFETEDVIYSSPAIGQDGTIYVGSGEGVYAINPNGIKKWDIIDDVNGIIDNWIDSSPSISADGIIYIGSSDRNLYAIDQYGTKKWEFLTGDSIYSSPAIGTDGTIYIGSNDGKLYAINPDGTEKWNFISESDICYSSPAIGKDGTIYIGSEDSNIYAINSDGTKKWVLKTDDWIESSPVIGLDDTVYIGSLDGNFYAINQDDGKEKWHLKIGDDVASSAAIGADGTIYILADGLWAIKGSSEGCSNAPWTMFHHDAKHTGRVSADRWVKISGTVRYENIPLCAIVLANGQHIFTCGENEGKYELEVPLDENGQITLFGFCDGLAPFKQILMPCEETLIVDIKMVAASPDSKKLTLSITTAPIPDSDWIKVSGSVSHDGTPLCAMVLINGQYMFSCDDKLGKYDLNVPLDKNGEITVFGFCDGFLPFKQIVKIR